MQKLGISGQEYQSGMSTAGGVYQQQAGIAGQMYGAQQGISQTAYSMNLANTQQGINNLQVLSAAGQGTYVGAQNYLSQAASSYGQGAQIAGTSAGAIGGLDMRHKENLTVKRGQDMELLGTLAGAGIAASDIRLKDNIKYSETINDIKFYTWDWTDLALELGAVPSETYGVIAQELQYQYPEFIIEREDGYLTVDYSGLYKELGV